MIVLFAALLGAAAYAGAAQAATATLFGSAVVEGDHVVIVSDLSHASTANDAGGVSFTGTGVTDFNSPTALSAQFNVTDDACRGGAPRFEIDFAGRRATCSSTSAPTTRRPAGSTAKLHRR